MVGNQREEMPKIWEVDLKSMRTVDFEMITQMTETNSALDCWEKMKVELVAVTKCRVPEKTVKVAKRASFSLEMKLAIKKSQIVW